MVCEFLAAFCQADPLKLTPTQGLMKSASGLQWFQEAEGDRVVAAELRLLHEWQQRQGRHEAAND